MRLTCTNCGGAFDVPAGHEASAFAADESARCARLREIADQRRALDAARTQAGFAGVTETLDRVAQQTSMERLDMALRVEAAGIEKAMAHNPIVEGGTKGRDE